MPGILILHRFSAAWPSAIASSYFCSSYSFSTFLDVFSSSLRIISFIREHCTRPAYLPFSLHCSAYMRSSCMSSSLGSFSISETRRFMLLSNFEISCLASSRAASRPTQSYPRGSTVALQSLSFFFACVIQLARLVSSLCSLSISSSISLSHLLTRSSLSFTGSEISRVKASFVLSGFLTLKTSFKSILLLAGASLKCRTTFLLSLSISILSGLASPITCTDSTLVLGGFTLKSIVASPPLG